MTNRLDMIDQAIVRRGRFDHIIRVEQADESEIRTLLGSMLDGLPKSEDVDIPVLSSLRRAAMGTQLKLWWTSSSNLNRRIMAEPQR